MAMSRHRGWQWGLWIATSSLARSLGHPFYEGLSQLLVEQDFAAFLERQRAGFCAPKMGRHSLAPALHFWLLLIGYFEGIDSERGVAWRMADSFTACETPRAPTLAFGWVAVGRIGSR